MAKDYRKLWKRVIRATDEAEAAWPLAEILAEKEGRIFISRLDAKNAESCIRILDHVRRNPHLPIHFVISDGLIRTS